MNLAEFIEGRRDPAFAELCELLRIPSVSAKSEHNRISSAAPVGRG